MDGSNRDLIRAFAGKIPQIFRLIQISGSKIWTNSIRSCFWGVVTYLVDMKKCGMGQVFDPLDWQFTPSPTIPIDVI